MSAPPNAGVHFPPPLVYATGLVVGWLLQRWSSLAVTTGRSTGRGVGAAVCVLAFLLLAGSAFMSFRRARTTLIPNRPAATLVTAGPYRITRNPMYLGLVTLYLGVALLMNSWWPVMLLPIVVVVIDRAVIAREERHLAEAFPTAYPAYCAKVRRWL